MRLQSLAIVMAIIPFACTGAYASSTRELSRSKEDVGDYTEPKYFHEARDSDHYDERFYNGILPENDQRDAIRVLVQTYLATFRELGVQTWLMHGSLLGWWWGKKIMPWDADADVQVSEADMYFLAAYYNMTTYYFKYESIPKGKTFLLEVNPYFRHRESDDWDNLIDARWIDMETGLFIDITAARYRLDHKEGEGVMYDKYDHEFRDTFVYPLLDTTFEGIPVKIPYGYKQMLQSEYGKSALTKGHFNKHYFDEIKMAWVLADGTEGQSTFRD